MTNPRTNVQGEFEDIVIGGDHAQDLYEAIEAKESTRDAAAANRKATAVIKELIGKPEKPTRYVVGETGYVVVASPYTADGIEIPAGPRLRIKVEGSSAS